MVKHRKKITFFYRNGEVHEITLKATNEAFEEIAEIINASFMDDLDGVLRLNDETASNFIRISDVSRIMFEKVD